MMSLPHMLSVQTNDILSKLVFDIRPGKIPPGRFIVKVLTGATRCQTGGIGRRTGRVVYSILQKKYKI